jgi:prepilin-type N-terminal cleavage/methylation domain-containing protein
MPVARSGFTLVEMIVGVALVLLVMVVLTQAFVSGTQAFRVLKGIGDLEERLRTANIILRADLQANHFEGNRKLSDTGFFNNGPPVQGFFRIFQGHKSTVYYDADGLPWPFATDHVLHFSVIRKGDRLQDYFVADVSQDPYSYTGPNATNPTAQWPSNPSGYQYGWANFAPPVPPARYQASTSYTSQVAEVAYFLRANGSTANGTKLYALCRRQLLAIPSQTMAQQLSSQTGYMTPSTHLYNQDPNAPGSAGAYREISCKANPSGSSIYFNSPQDLTVPERRFNMYPGSPTVSQYGGVPMRTDGLQDGTYSVLGDATTIPGTANDVFLTAPFAGSDVLLQDVISFDVQVMYRIGGVNFVDLPASTTNPLWAGSGVPGSFGYVFDTWSATQDPYYTSYASGWSSSGNNYSIPNQIEIQAIRIVISIWDRKTEQTRQVTIAQDM